MPQIPAFKFRRNNYRSGGGFLGIAIAVTSGKGGTGKTSLAAGVASHLALLGRSVICVDADVGLRNLDIVLGLSEISVMDFADVLRGVSPERAAVSHPLIPGLSLLPAPAYMDPADIDMRDMHNLVKKLADLYEYCIIDCPAGLGHGFRLACGGADAAIVVAMGDAASLRDAQRAVTELLALNVNDACLVVNRVRSRLISRSDSANLDEAMDACGIPLLGAVPDDLNVLSCGNHGWPLALGAKRGASAAYENIARRIMGERVPLLRRRAFR